MVWSEASRTIFGEPLQRCAVICGGEGSCPLQRLPLLAGVAFCRWFGRGDFLRGLVADPVGMENSRLIDALVGMSAEVVALRLQQICRQTRGTITIEVGKR